MISRRQMQGFVRRRVKDQRGFRIFSSNRLFARPLHAEVRLRPSFLVKSKESHSIIIENVSLLLRGQEGGGFDASTANPTASGQII